MSGRQFVIKPVGEPKRPPWRVLRFAFDIPTTKTSTHLPRPEVCDASSNVLEQAHR
jgi:hypothetical protein